MDWSAADHALGVELQLEELVDRADEARRHGWPQEAEALEPEITALQGELAETAERVAAAPDPVAIHGAHRADD